MADTIQPLAISNVLSDVEVNRILWYAISHDPSDLLVDYNYPVRIDVNGCIHEITDKPLQPEACKQFLLHLLGSRQGLINKINQSEPIYFAHITTNPEDKTDVRSFRVASLTSRSLIYDKTYKIVCRLNPDMPRSAEELYIEPELVDIVRNSRKGIALFIGGTGTGKTTTMAGIIRTTLETPSNGKHIVIFEDPPEVNYEKVKKAKGNSVSVHEVGTTETGSDVLSFDSGLVAALRLRPDILVQGEIRKKASIIYALNFANTGHFLMATLHANSCETAMTRIYNMAEGEGQKTIIKGFISSLSVLVAQILVITTTGDRIAIREVVYLKDDLKEKLLNADSNVEIASIIRNDLEGRGKTFKQQIQALYRDGLVPPESLFMEVH